MTWIDCFGSSSAQSDFLFACGSNDQQQALVCSFRLDQPLDQVIGLIAVVDAISAAPALPDWWRLAATGDCRSGNLVASASHSGLFGCLDPWQGAASADVQGFGVTEPRGEPNTFRIKAVAGVPVDSARTLVAGELYFGIQVVILNDKSTGPLACAGCAEPACIVLNSIQLARDPATPGGDRVISIPGPGNGNWATWNGGTGANCMAVPVRRTTWGTIHRLYR